MKQTSYKIRTVERLASQQAGTLLPEVGPNQTEGRPSSTCAQHRRLLEAVCLSFCHPGTYSGLLTKGCAQFWGETGSFFLKLHCLGGGTGISSGQDLEPSRLQRLEKQPSFIAQLIKLPLQNSVHLFSEQTLGVKARKIQYF